jgi:hypothetical protein
MELLRRLLRIPAPNPQHRAYGSNDEDSERIIRQAEERLREQQARLKYLEAEADVTSRRRPNPNPPEPSGGHR